MAYKLFTATDETPIKEIKNVGELEWSDDLDYFTTQMSFKSTDIVDIGNQIILFNDKTEILRGIVIDRGWDKNKIYEYTVFDFGFYLGKNEVIVQFNGCTISEAIRQLLNKVNIPIGEIVEIPACVKKIYKKVLISDIIRELLEMAKKKTGIDYILRVRGRQIHIEEFIKIEIYPTYDLNGDTINITEYIGNFSARDSIQDMKNRVKITDNKEDKIYILAEAKDEASIKKYGQLQVIETPDEDDKTPKSVIAQNMLNKLNKITSSRSIEMLGSDEIKKGVLLSFNYPEFGFVGQHLVISTHHNIDDVMHKVNVDFEVYDG